MARGEFCARTVTDGQPSPTPMRMVTDRAALGVISC
jgi:hypothetical protein